MTSQPRRCRTGTLRNQGETMNTSYWNRRDFIRTLLASIPFAAFDWSAFPKKTAADDKGNQWDVVIIGSGLGGLSCAAAFARQGYRPLVLEKHDRPGGYATTFKRPGGFVFDVSLHSTSVSSRNGVYNMVPGFPEITEVEFVPHPNLYRAVFPDYDITVPNRDLPGYLTMLKGHFPEEAQGIDALFKDMKGIAQDVEKLSTVTGEMNFSRFPVDFPFLFKAYSRTWGQIVDEHLKEPRLKAMVNVLWGYFGLPPSKLASIYYALPTIGYLENGGFYPRGKSQAISNAFVKFIEQRGGKVLLATKVDRILVKDRAAFGVATADGKEFTGKAIVSNADAYTTFHTLVERTDDLAEYLARMDSFTVSLSSFQVFLGLKRNLVRELGIKDTEIFCAPDYDPEQEFRAGVEGNMERPGYGLTLYDNLYAGYSPQGKNTLSITTLQGYDYWKKYEAEYLRGEKTAYVAEKERIANILIDQAERRFLPGLRKAIEVKEIGTPLTNLRFTGNYRGGIYGWDQTLDNAMPNRLPQTTPIKGLYLAGAWTQPGGGYGGVIWSGVQCFGEVMKAWG